MGGPLPELRRMEHARRAGRRRRCKGKNGWPQPTRCAPRRTRSQSSTTAQEIRFPTGMGELDRVLGGGAVQGSLVLVGGAPGIGKSTLMLQICGKLSETAKILYVSGEESPRQLKLRADRLGVQSDNLYVLSETCLGDVLESVEEEKPDVLIVDSIQTLYQDSLESPAGSVAQVRACTLELMRWPKGRASPSLSSGTSTKRVLLRARRCWSTWSTAFYISRVRRT